MKHIPTQLKYLISFGALLLLIEIVNILTGRLLSHFGVFPREITSLGYIFTAPLIHGNLGHLFSNLVPLLIFAGLVWQWGTRTFFNTTFLVVVLSGLAVWLFGRTAIHIGASGLLYGYFGFLVLAGFISKRITYLLISILVIALYGGIVFGILPTHKYVSFEYHLFGFVAGLIAAKLWGNTVTKTS